MDIDLLTYVVNQLNARGRAAWAEIAEKASVPESTIEKIAYGVTTDPRVLTVQALATVLMNSERT